MRARYVGIDVGAETIKVVEVSPDDGRLRWSRRTVVKGRRSMVIRPAVQRIAALVVLAASTAGCATIVNGRTQDVALASTPAGATVTVDGTKTTTPGSVTSPRENDHNLVFEKEGFPQRQTKLESTGSWWLLGNALFGGLIGLVIDLVSGGGYKLTPASVDVEMESGQPRQIEKPASVVEAAPPAE